MRNIHIFSFLWQNIFMFPLLSLLSIVLFGKRNSLRASMPLTSTLTDLTPSEFGLEKLARNHTIHVGLVEGNSVRTGPKSNKGTICNNIWTQLIDAH